MPRPKQYQRIAERYAEASGLTNRRVPEASGFAAYHAFESIGCAWIRHCGQRVPRSPHRAKTDAFVHLSRARPFGRGAATLAILLNALRNDMLYPIQDGTGFILPEDRMSEANARDLLRRVRGLMAHVSAEL